jgi:hypothetical protein
LSAVERPRIRTDATMIIRDEQMQALAAHAEANFHLRVRQTLKSDFPEGAKEIPEEALAAFVKQGVARARQNGVVVERDVAAFVIFLFCLRLVFRGGEPPWVEELLKREDLIGGVKVAQMRERGRQEMKALRNQNGAKLDG